MGKELWTVDSVDPDDVCSKQIDFGGTLGTPAVPWLRLGLTALRSSRERALDIKGKSQSQAAQHVLLSHI